MHFRCWMPRLAAAAALAGWTGVAEAQSARFLGLNDGFDGRYFDAAVSRPDALNRNRLVIGFNSGIDPDTWVHREFIASVEAFYRSSAMDTLSFVIRAPAGYAVASVTYSQAGSGVISRLGRVSGGTSWVVAGKASHLGMFTTNPALTGTVSLAGQRRTTVPVSITTSLFAFAPVGSATLSITGASVSVTLEPLVP